MGALAMTTNFQNSINLEEAVNQIKQVSDEHFNVGKMSPYFILAGAGISYPSAPLAKDIIEHCKDNAKKLGRENFQTPLNSTTQDEYSTWFELAYPNRQQRQNFLKKMLFNKPIPPANIKLAHILSNIKITNLVVTTNFDDFLSRSLNIFGIPHIVSDHPHTVEKVNLESEYVQIVHIHGTYWFYDCCNLQSEIVQRAERLLNSNLTMSFFIDSLLYRRVPIVVGYSGWENDVFMQALKRRLQSPLPYNLFWFCYSKESFEALPKWLKENIDVKFVFPIVTNSVVENDDKNLGIIGDLNFINNEIEESRKSKLLDAQLVFEHFINIFDIESPYITRDPIGFFVETLKSSFESNNSEAEKNKYFLEDVISRLERAKDSKEYNTNAFIEDLKELIKKSQYNELISKIVNEYDPKSFSIDEHQLLLSVLLDASENISDNAEGFIIVRKISEKLYTANTKLVWIKQTLCKALLGEGKNLSDRELYNDAVYCFDQILNDQRFKEFEFLRINALLNKAYAYRSLEKREQEIFLYDEIVKMYSGSSEIKIKRKVSRALFDKCVCLIETEDNEQLLECVDYLAMLYNSESDSYIRKIVARANLTKAIAFLRQDLYDESFIELEQIISACSNEEEVGFKKLIATSLQVKGNLLRMLDRHKEAFEVYDELENRFKNVEELALKEYAVGAMLNKARYLDETGFHEEAIKVYENVITEYSDIDDLSEEAQLSKADSYVKLGKNEDAIQIYNNIIDLNKEVNLTNLEYVSEAFINKGTALAKNKQHEQAIATYLEFIKIVKKIKVLVAKEYWASCMLNLAASYKELNNFDQAHKSYDDVFNKFKSHKETSLKKYVARALFNKALTFGILDQDEEAVKVFNQSYMRLRNEEDISLRQYASRALYNKGIGYKKLRDYEKAKVVFELLVSKFKDCEDDEIRQYTYYSLINKCSILLEQGRSPTEVYEMINIIELDKIKLIPNKELVEKYMDLLTEIGFNAYNIESNYELAKKSFFSSYILGEVTAGINLAYMLRRQEINDEGIPSVEILLEGSLKTSDPFAIVNKVLFDIQENNSDETWEKCEKLISSIHEVDSVFKWWSDVALKGEAEGHLIVGWLCRNKGMSDPTGKSYIERFTLANELGIHVPGWIFNKVGSIY